MQSKANVHEMGGGSRKEENKSSSYFQERGRKEDATQGTKDRSRSRSRTPERREQVTGSTPGTITICERDHRWQTDNRYRIGTKRNDPRFRMEGGKKWVRPQRNYQAERDIPYRSNLQEQRGRNRRKQRRNWCNSEDEKDSRGERVNTRPAQSWKRRGKAQGDRRRKCVMREEQVQTRFKDWRQKEQREALSNNQNWEQERHKGRVKERREEEGKESNEARGEMEREEKQMEEKRQLRRTIETLRKENDIMKEMLKNFRKYKETLKEANSKKKEWGEMEKWGQTPIDKDPKKPRMEAEGGSQ